MFSIWERQSFLKADIIIVGAGITGLSTAASLKELKADLNILVLERGVLPSGASTKNAGFACFGSISELQKDIEDLGEDGMVQLVEKRIKGLAKTTSRLGKQSVDLQVKGGYELLLEKDDAVIDQMKKINRLLHLIYNDFIYQCSDDKIQTFGFGNTSHLIENKFEGQLDTGKLLSSLWDYCSHLGVKIFTGCEISSIHQNDRRVDLLCDDLVFQAEKVGVCTNAFSKKLLNKNINLKPGRGMVMSILPEKQLKISGTFHYDKGYYYFRDYYGKLIFGGARNLALKEETTLDFGINHKIKKKLMEDLKQIILPNQKFKIEHEWSGIMAFGENKSPIIRKVSDRVAIGVRLAGMGVAIGSLVGEELAGLLVN